MAAPVVGADREGVMTRYGRRFYKLSGSGNDFVFVDTRTEPAGPLEQPATVWAVCARATGVGADGVVFVEPPRSADEKFSIRYLNRDGSLALLCGNASLCSVRVAVELGIVDEGEEFVFGTGAGPARGRFTPDGPEIDLQPVAELAASTSFETRSGEQRIGFAMVGVPHVVILCDDVESVDIEGRGRPIRYDPRLAAGANVNFVSARPDGSWSMRTYERGVEAETLACGTGSVATAALLQSWGRSGSTTTIWTRSGMPLRVRFRETAAGVVTPSLNGEGRIVFRGELAS
jgi:diaminopimelate epimerase